MKEIKVRLFSEKHGKAVVEIKQGDFVIKQVLLVDLKTAREQFI